MGRACADRIARARRRHRAGRDWLRRHRPGGRRSLLQHRDDRLRGDPHRSVLCGPDHHLHVPPYRQCRHQRRRHRDREPGGDAGRARRGAAFRHHRAVELSRHKASRCLAEEPRRHRACRHRHPRAHRPHSRKRHAERGHCPRAVRPLRCRSAQARGQSLARPPRHGSRADGDHRPAFYLERNALGLGRRLRPEAATPNTTSSPSTTASSATFCASSPAMPAMSR